MSGLQVRSGGGLVVQDRTGSGGGLSVQGYSVPFYVPTLIYDSWDGYYYEQFAPTALAESLRAALPQMLWGHGQDVTGQVPIGVWQSMRGDAKGLFAKGTMFDNQLVRPVRDAVAGGAPLGQSISFFPEEDEVTPKYRDGLQLVTRTKVRLDEVSIVRRPAYPTTSIAMTSDEGTGRSSADGFDLAALLARNERNRQEAEADWLKLRTTRKAYR